jgi:hypothetical protein
LLLSTWFHWTRLSKNAQFSFIYIFYWRFVHRIPIEILSVLAVLPYANTKRPFRPPYKIETPFHPPLSLFAGSASPASRLQRLSPTVCPSLPASIRSLYKSSTYVLSNSPRLPPARTRLLPVTAVTFGVTFIPLGHLSHTRKLILQPILSKSQHVPVVLIKNILNKFNSLSTSKLAWSHQHATWRMPKANWLWRSVPHTFKFSWSFGLASLNSFPPTI